MLSGWTILLRSVPQATPFTDGGAEGHMGAWALGSGVAEGGVEERLEAWGKVEEGGERLSWIRSSQRPGEEKKPQRKTR